MRTSKIVHSGEFIAAYTNIKKEERYHLNPNLTFH